MSDKAGSASDDDTEHMVTTTAAQEKHTSLDKDDKIRNGQKGIHIGDPHAGYHGNPAATGNDGSAGPGGGGGGYPLGGMNGYALYGGGGIGAAGGVDVMDKIKMEDSMAAAAYGNMELSPNGQRTRKNKEDKICGVCGDRALGYNFDAISCESCKAFFRRNAPKGLDYFKCPYDEKCKMDISNRRFCKRCRLKKCFEIGMRKEYILSEEEKLVKRQKIEQNRPRAQRYPSDCPRQAKNMSGVSKLEPVKSGTLSATSKMLRDLDRSGSSSGGAWGGSPSSMGPCSSPGGTDQRSMSPQMQTRPLGEEDHALIQELLCAYDSSLEISVDKEPSRNLAQGMADLVNIAEVSVRRVIDMAKKVKAFKSLPQLDQISLLKGGSIELLILRSVITFDKDKQHFLDPLDQEESSAMTVEQFRRAETGLGLFDDHMNFVKSLAIDLRADKTTLILLLMISLFSPDRPQISNKQLVALEQEHYSMILENYLESKYPYTLAHAVFPKLLMKLTDIRNLNEEHSQVLLKVNPEGIQPLMQEVLDLRAAAGGLAPPDGSQQPPTSSPSSSSSPPAASTQS